jgi:oligosaccharyltransferase complex subunit epsilon
LTPAIRQPSRGDPGEETSSIRPVSQSPVLDRPPAPPPPSYTPAALRCSPIRTQVLDIYIGAALLTIVLQFAYASLVGTFPFNSFLAGVFCCAGSAVLTLCLRLQISSGQLDMPVDRAFVEYALAMVVLFLACFCYLG